MTTLCPFKNIFGEPRKGVHSLRFFDIAVVDVTFTILAAWIIHYFTRGSFVCILVTIFLLGIFLHYLFCVETTINRMIYSFFNKKNHNF